MPVAQARQVRGGEIRNFGTTSTEFELEAMLTERCKEVFDLIS